jgi:hypothetical protein
MSYRHCRQCGTPTKLSGWCSDHRYHEWLSRDARVNPRIELQPEQPPGVPRDNRRWWRYDAMSAFGTRLTGWSPGTRGDALKAARMALARAYDEDREAAR